MGTFKEILPFDSGIWPPGTLATQNTIFVEVSVFKPTSSRLIFDKKSKQSDTNSGTLDPISNVVTDFYAADILLSKV